MVKTHNVYTRGKVHIRRHQCETCIFGPHSPVGAERRNEMVAKAGDFGCIPCHHHLAEKLNPVCHGFYAQKGNLTLRMAEAFDVIEWTD
jgi:hypothetical protein